MLNRLQNPLRKCRNVILCPNWRFSILKFLSELVLSKSSVCLFWSFYSQQVRPWNTLRAPSLVSLLIVGNKKSCKFRMTFFHSLSPWTGCKIRWDDVETWFYAPDWCFSGWQAWCFYFQLVRSRNKFGMTLINQSVMLNWLQNPLRRCRNVILSPVRCFCILLTCGLHLQPARLWTKFRITWLNFSVQVPLC